MFSDRFDALCAMKGVRAGKACREMGVSRSLASKWKSEKTEKPSTEVLEKMADYFGLSIEEILYADLNESISFKINMHSAAGIVGVPQSDKVIDIVAGEDFNDGSLRFALWGEPADDVTAEDMKAIREYAEYIRQKRKGAK